MPPHHRGTGSQPTHLGADTVLCGEPQILDDEIEEVVACLRSGWIGTGPRVAQFERDFAVFKRTSYVAALGSCSAALQLSLLCAGIEPGDEVITSAMTFCGAVNAIVHAGARPVPADVDPRTLNLDARDVEARITPRTRAIVPVHFAGRPCDMRALVDLARAHDLQIVEDCAHALEAEYHGRTMGTIGAFGCFSFYATKHVTTAEGGMVILPGERELVRIKRLAQQGLSADAWERLQTDTHRYRAVEIGFKCNMTDLQAALGIHQLRRVEANWQRRHAIWQQYDEAFADAPLTLPAPAEPMTRHAHHLYTVMVDRRVAGVTRDEFIDRLRARGIRAGLHYPSVGEHPAYTERFGWEPEAWPDAMHVGRQTASLPLGPSLTDKDTSRVIAAVRNSLGLG
jgi:dTDP-4-amino-4,6-dideoxygalactose transaminase